MESGSGMKFRRNEDGTERWVCEDCRQPIKMGEAAIITNYIAGTRKYFCRACMGKTYEVIDVRD